MTTYLITGCSRGIGLEMVRQLTRRPSAAKATIIATSRASEPTTALVSLVREDHRIHYIKLDIEDRSSIIAAVSQVEQLLGDRGLDVLINNAGVQFSEAGRAPGMDALEKTLSTNVVAVHNVTSSLLPLLRKGQQKKIVNITSTLGSVALIENFALSPTPSYKISKAALNMMTTQYGMDLGKEGFIVVAISPGWLKTDLGGQYADLEPQFGVESTLNIIDGLTSKDNDAFRDIYVAGHEMYSGSNPPW